ncbi:lysophospholipase L1-like esterase [Pseudonocardia hierapolitana]|uniref:Lysophospholipase L1-like esterase n=1 Tax=Pseudonocardia hierapolitana TaxID=1128676 RepID=A0A561STQ1_9PSEU|nr:GDSL-type esterase/lipase family protein [Pseudonocardia hierapolitana]TWF78235.1 lysophospholipase L1-like esterase [Pseudonocardia hierapolitana]
MTISADRRVCFAGDSYVAGVGDPEHRGWVGRVVAQSYRGGRPVTAYNLGVRRDTSEDVRRRLPAETGARWVAGCDNRLVVSFGVNDTTEVDGAVRVTPERSVAHLRGIAEDAVAQGVPLLVVGPPPVAEPDQNERIEALDGLFAGSADGVFTYVSVFGALRVERDWMRAVAIGDGAHPGAEGYRLLAELVRPAWEDWLG